MATNAATALTRRALAQTAFPSSASSFSRSMRVMAKTTTSIRRINQMSTASGVNPARRGLSTAATGMVGMLSRMGTSQKSSSMMRVGNQSVRTMFIQTETTPNDASLKFIPGVTVMPNNGTHEILDARSSLVSPLAVKLMGIDGVTSIFFGPDFVTVSKDDSQPWNLLKPEIFAILMEHFTSGKALFNKDNKDLEDGPQDTKILDTDSEVVAMIKELLDTRVRPAIQEDGGDLEYKGFDEDSGIVSVRLKGSCRGCSSSSVTLKSGIERMLQHYIPEVQAVEQILDEEEVIAAEEFAKLEKRLEAKNPGSTRDTNPMSQYMSL